MHRARGDVGRWCQQQNHGGDHQPHLRRRCHRHLHHRMASRCGQDVSLQKCVGDQIEPRGGAELPGADQSGAAQHALVGRQLCRCAAQPWIRRHRPHRRPHRLFRWRRSYAGDCCGSLASRPLQGHLGRTGDHVRRQHASFCPRHCRHHQVNPGRLLPDLCAPGWHGWRHHGHDRGVGLNAAEGPRDHSSQGHHSHQHWVPNRQWCGLRLLPCPVRVYRLQRGAH
mmetsp:Transcript_21161/g.55095  ORF Transcript_21161/g.55095 Transcript_21161/m.55095 type:complete len:225 (+) Transcript_21161:249-923(+)